MSVFPLDELLPGARLVRITSGSPDRAIIGLMAVVAGQVAGGANLIVLELGERHEVHPVTVRLLAKVAERLGTQHIGFCLVQRENLVDAALGEASTSGLLELHASVADALRVHQ